MRAIKWETIKANAEREFFNRAGGNKSTIGYGQEQDQAYFLALLVAVNMTPPQSPIELAKDWIEKGCKLIRQWDVRMVRKLMELFPTCVPKFCHTQPIAADYDESGDWVVCFGNPDLDVH